MTDLLAAHEMFGDDTPRIAVNGAARDVRAFALFSYHPKRFVEYGYDWIAKQRKRFGNGFTVHASAFVEGCPFVHHWWEGARGGGGSAWGARKLAKLMGFDPVILCGCPMEPGEYFGHRPGMIMAKQEQHDFLRGFIEAEPEWHAGCYSMSGWTRELLGFPSP